MGTWVGVEWVAGAGIAVRPTPFVGIGAQHGRVASLLQHRLLTV